MSEAPGGFPAVPEYRITSVRSPRRVRVVFGGSTVADSRSAILLHETRLPPVYYLPREDVCMELMEATSYRTHCPFKGDASYFSLRVGDQVAENAVWSYEDPLPEAEAVRGYVAFYRSRMDAWIEDDAEVRIDPVTDVHAHGNPLVDWLLRDAWEATSIGELTARFARQLAASGIPLFRLNLMVRALHPLVLGTAYVWRADEDRVEERVLSHQRAQEEIFLASPFVPIFAGRGGVRRRLEGPDAALDFPILRDLHMQGVTDYAAMPLPFSDGKIHALTLSSDRPGGFDVQSLGHVHEILPLLSRLVEVHSLRRTARTLLDTYLGTHTGERVLEGLIRRGDGEVIPAVIWWADLRGSTALAEMLPRQAYLDLLNDFFERSAGAVIDRGGEVLKFVGDAVLAIFAGRDVADDARCALDAARATLDRIGSLNARRGRDGQPPVGVVVALHHGDVHYGNVGVSGRLDFTVTGPAVNEISRLEGLSKQLDRPVLASGSFARLVPGGLASVGRYALRGVAGEQEVFSLPPDRGSGAVAEGS